jgi:TP901 family phage tail tape measure protein
MANKIKYTDLFDESLNKNIDELSKKINEIGKSVESLKKTKITFTGSGDELRQQEIMLNNVIKSTKQLQDNEIKLEKLKEQKVKTQKAEYDLSVKQIKEAERLAKEMEKKQKFLQKEIELEKSASDSLLRKRKSLIELTKQYDSADASLRNKLIPDIQKLQKEIMSLEAATGRHQRNVGNYKSALDGLGSKFLPDIQKLQKEIMSLEAVTGRHQRNVGNYKSALDGLGSSFLGIATAVGGVTLGIQMITNVFRDAGKTVVEFEKSMSQVSAITGATGDNLERLRALAKKMGAETAFTAKQAADGMIALGMAGFNTNEIIAALPSTLSLAAAGGIELGKAADIVSNVMAGFGANANETGRYVDVLAKSANTANVTIESMGESFKEIASTAKIMNVDVEEVGALINVLGNAGIKGTNATNALQSSLLRIADATPEMKKAMKDMGLELFDANGQFIGITNTIKELNDKTKDYTQEQKLAAVSTIFGKNSANQWLTALTTTKNVLVSDMNPAMKQYFNVQEGINNITLEGADVLKYYEMSLKDAGGAAQKMAKTMLDNISGKLTLLSSAWDGFILSIEDGTGSMGDAVKSIIGFLTDIVNNLYKLGEAWQPVADVMLSIKQSFSALGEALGLANTEFSVGKTLIDAIAINFRILSTVISMVLKPLTLLIDGLTWLYNNVTAISTGINAIADAFTWLWKQAKQAAYFIGLLDATGKKARETSSILDATDKASQKRFDNEKKRLEELAKLNKDKKTSFFDTEKLDAEGKTKSTSDEKTSFFDTEKLDAEGKALDELAFKAKSTSKVIYESINEARMKVGNAGMVQDKSFIEQMFGSKENAEQVGKTFKDLADKYIAEMQKMKQARIDAVNEDIEQSNNRMDNLLEQYKIETDLMEKGAANDVDTVKKEIALEKKKNKDLQEQRKQALKEKQDADRLAMISDSLSQASSLITSIANIFKTNTGSNPYGVFVAIGLIGTLLAAFSSFSSSVKGYAKGGEVDGEGTETSDSVPALLSKNEFVMPADKYKKSKKLVNMIYKGKLNDSNIGDVNIMDTSKLENINENQLKLQKKALNLQMKKEPKVKFENGFRISHE